jgi:hypothetical protein
MDRLPSNPAFFRVFAPKRDVGTLQPLRQNIDWLRMLPQGTKLAEANSDALDAAITRLVQVCAASQAADSGDSGWSEAFVRACDDLQVKCSHPAPCPFCLFAA